MATPQRKPEVKDAGASPTASTVPGTVGTVGTQDVSVLGDEVKDCRVPKPSQCPNGLLDMQPLTVHEPEPFLDELDLEIPDLADDLAPKPVLGGPQLSPAAVRSRAKRIFQKRADGSKKVSDEIWADWHAKGSKRRNLEEIFKRCGYDADT